jgi:hypothetical protein
MTRPYARTLAYHKLHPEVSLERYVRSKVLETADRVLARKRIYLDTRYWIALRDVQLQRPRSAIDRELLNTLTQLVRGGKAICPINANLFAELLKQRDERTRLATAQVIDQLSLGIAIQPEDERVGTEIMHCLQRSLRGEDALEPLERLVWTSVSYLLGYTFPTVDIIPEGEMLAWRKSLTDDFWNIPFSDQISILGDAPTHFDVSWDRIAEKINRETQEHGGIPKSFKQVHLDEFVGFLDGFIPAMRQMVSRVTAQGMGLHVSDEVQLASEEDARILLRILREAFRKNKLGTQLPSVVIKSGLYAAIRWNRGRQYKGNDLHDFGHASAAMFYCDYFATDAGLRHLVNDELRYDQKYAVTVVDNASALLQAIRQL